MFPGGFLVSIGFIYGKPYFLGMVNRIDGFMVAITIVPRPAIFFIILQISEIGFPTG
jgi:hypothetical protein